MIKIFRRLRNQLLPENPPAGAGRAGKFGKYIIYAVGEIVLVVIGILIALSINNWNIDKIESKKEQVILKGLKTTFEKNHEELKNKYASTKEAYDAALKLLDYIKPELAAHSVRDIDSLISSMINYSTYNPSIGTVENIINSGDLNLIKNEKLKNYISDWSGMLNDTDKDIKITNDHTFNAMLAFLMQNANLKNAPIPDRLLSNTLFTSKAASNFTPDYKQLLTSLEFENLVDFHSLNLVYLSDMYIKLETYLDETIALLEKEID